MFNDVITVFQINSNECLVSVKFPNPWYIYITNYYNVYNINL